MPLFTKARSLLQNLFSFRRADADLDHEVHSHLEMLTEEKIRSGISPDEAQRSARIELGGIEQLKEQIREERLGNWIHSVLSDCRFAFRQFRKSPTFTVASLITFTVGIGSNTAIFSFADLLLNHPVSFEHLSRLVSVDQIRADGEETPLSPANFRDLRVGIESLESFASYQQWSPTLLGSSGAEECNGMLVGEDFFATFEAKPFLGRTFFPEEHRPGNHRVVVLSYAFWQREFAGDAQVTHKTLRLDEQNYSIVGVMPPNFQFPPGGTQFWTPLALDSQQAADRDHGTLATVGRLKPTAQLKQSRAEFGSRWAELQQRFPETNRHWKLSVLSLSERLVDQDSRQFATLFLCVAAFVLLIACVNVANLQLARAASRERELSIRAALGAERKRIVRQLFTESLFLSTISSIGGLLLASWGVALMRAKMPAQVRGICDVSAMRVDLRAFLFTLFAAMVAGLLSGVIPALRSSKVNLRNSLETGGARVASGGHRLRRAFVLCEVILAVVLLIGAGLMVKGFYLLANRQTGMNPQTLLTFHVNLSASRYATPEQQRAFYIELLDRLRAVSGVEAVSGVSGLPFSFYENEQKVLTDESRGVPETDLPSLMDESISDGYFRVLRLPLLEGRPFDQRDGSGAPSVGIISESAAARLWPGAQQIIGRRLKLPNSDAPNDWITVVGIVGNTRHEVYDRSFRSVLYKPLAQSVSPSLDFALRISADPQGLTGTIRSTIADVDPNQPVSAFLFMTEKINEQASALQFVATLMGLFGLVAILLSAAGIYGLVAYSVAERRREIGIRMALGARAGQVMAMVVKLGISLVAIGGAIGLVNGFILAQFLSSFLYGVQAWDPTIYALVPLLLLPVALLATFLPALRASRVDPMVALRYE
jgi:putative ABC transport system permease protein